MQHEKCNQMDGHRTGRSCIGVYSNFMFWIYGSNREHGKSFSEFSTDDCSSLSSQRNVRFVLRLLVAEIYNTQKDCYRICNPNCGGTGTIASGKGGVRPVFLTQWYRTTKEAS